jgi:hypothetical protein
MDLCPISMVFFQRINDDEPSFGISIELFLRRTLQHLVHYGAMFPVREQQYKMN